MPLHSLDSIDAALTLHEECVLVQGLTYLGEVTKRSHGEKTPCQGKSLEEESGPETKPESPEGHGFSDSSVIFVIQIPLLTHILLGLMLGWSRVGDMVSKKWKITRAVWLKRRTFKLGQGSSSIKRKKKSVGRAKCRAFVRHEGYSANSP